MTVSRCLTLALVLVGLAGVVSAQNLTSRNSEARFNATYGGGETALTPDGEVLSTSLAAGGLVSILFSDTRNGFVLNDPNRPWGATVSSESKHEYDVTGPLNSFSKISARGSTAVAASSSGEGLATIVSSESLELRFSLDSSKLMRLKGFVELTPNGQNLAGQVALQKFDGIVWGSVFNSWFLPGQEGTFDQTYDLTSGSYRILGNSSGNAFHGVRPSQSNAWEYQLEVVPEPATVAALGLGVLAALRRRRKG